MIKGFFFDLDGTLVDTHQANFEAYRNALSDFGVSITFDDFKKTLGYQAQAFLPKLAPSLSSEIYVTIAEKKAEYYKDFVHLSKANTALIQFLESIAKHHVTALVTTAKSQNAQRVLVYHNLARYFDLIITADDVKMSKPHPEAYELALARTNLSPEEVVVFEDSEAGIQAAEAAGLKALVRIRISTQ